MDRAEVGHARGPEVVEPLEGARRRAQHRPIRWAPARGVGEHVGEEQPLRQLDALLVGELALQLGGDAGAGGREPGKALGRVEHELLVAQLDGEVVGEHGVDSLDVRAQEALAGGVQGIGDRTRRRLLALGAPLADREVAEQRLALGQELARGGGVGLERTGRLGRSRLPGDYVLVGEPDCFEHPVNMS